MSIRLMAFDELMNEFCVCKSAILGMENLTREEKSVYAEMLVLREKENHPEWTGFHFEKDESYFDYNAFIDYLYEIGEEEEGLEGEELESFVQAMYEEEIAQRNDLGFDF